MSTVETAVAWAEAVAADDAHGYDQGSRWGPDYDCSSLVISAYRHAGLALGCSYTGNMRPDMLSHGFRDVTGEVDLASGAGLRRGDVLLNITHHTALYTGGGRLVHAAGNEFGGATLGRTGDQTGREITVSGYFNFPWDCVLRYEDPSASGEAYLPEEEGYTVRPGDSLWAIAERLLGSGSEYVRLKEWNGLTDNTIRPGQVLRLRPTESKGGGEARCLAELPRLRRGSTGPAVEALQTLLLLRGESLPRFGADGELGDETAAALRRLTGSDTADAKQWQTLVG